MRVRNLQTYLREQKCVRVGNLSICRGMRLGIDAVYFFKSLKSLNDPLSDAYASLSPSFIPCLEEQLNLMMALELQPLFVFQGMQPKSHMLLSAQMIGFTMHDGWAAYVKGEESLALSKFSQHIYKEYSEDTLQLLMSYLKGKGYEIIRAPYLASSQLVYFMQEGLIDAVIGPPSTLLFGVPRVIMGLDLVKSTFEWVELDELLSTWSIDREQFIDCCLLAGTEHCLSYPLLTQPFSFSNAIEYIKQAPLIKYLYQLPTRDRINEYIDGYCIAKSLITHPLVMTLGGEVTNLSKSDSLPSDYHKIVGSKLPKPLYYLLSEGLISVQLPFALALGEWIDEPNQNADSLEFRDLLTDLREYQCRALGLLVMKLDDQFRTKQIRYPRYVSLMKTHAMKQSAKLLIPNTCQIKNWYITKELLDLEMKRQNTQDIGLEFCLNWHNFQGLQLLYNGINTNGINSVTVLAHTDITNTNTNNNTNTSSNGVVNEGVGGEGDAVGPSTVTGDTVTDDTVTGEDIKVMNVLLNFMLLENLGYFTNELGSTAFGRVLSSSGLGMTGLLILELMKFGLFTGEPFESPPDVPYAPELQYKSDDKRLQMINLIGRLGTLTNVTLDTRIWMGKIDFDIASFNMVVKFLKRTINYLTESSLSYLLLSDINRFAHLRNGVFDPLNPQLPLFYSKPSFLGVVLKVLLLENLTLESLNRTFPNCINLKQDLTDFTIFWSKIYTMLHNLSYLIQLGDVLECFDGATLLLKNKFDKLGIDTNILKL
ncbi:uncharacterized protein TA09370 [Theileria annulata]|uniref:XPG-I domain-containing protein n=1 Tax=Theileria annulata TaxID=5874 RepID=Q4UAD3_THEAN|nr:uncharacterized protein TA09370 [Theileria annulata]CAI76218.1 hypothetical protein, conserved [Theileria annulata]|eukprot:XP_952843.1 hypothetical protein, conserved [Theileria annulata]